MTIWVKAKKHNMCINLAKHKHNHMSYRSCKSNLGMGRAKTESCDIALATSVVRGLCKYFVLMFALRSIHCKLSFNKERGKWKSYQQY